MAQTINTNVASLNAQRNLNASQGSLATSLQRLSSGLRINSAKDDAAGLAISERFNTQIRGLNQAVRNANDGVSLAQTAEGDLVQIGENLQRMRELAVQSSNATNSNSDREALQKEISALTSEVDRIASQSSFNGLKLLNGSFVNQSFQVGANAGETIQISNINSAQANSIGGYKFSSTAVSSAGLAAGDLTIKVGDSAAVAVGASVAGAGAGQTVDSAWSKAQAINSANAGVTATAKTVQQGTAFVADAGKSGKVTINDVETATITTTADANTTQSAVISAINAISDKTGVTASVGTTGIALTAADGRNIDLNLGGDLTAANTTLAATNEYRGTIDFVSSNANVTVGGDTPAAAGLSANEQTTELKSVADVNISTQSGAQGAISVLDSALQAINNTRADLGAIQNRFTSVSNSLQVTSENISASRGRIVDADFAQETANLTRAQILQQAGTAMLAQANGLPQNVLSLLRG